MSDPSTNITDTNVTNTNVTDTTNTPFNYAQAAGIYSFRLALIFCLIYVPLLLIFGFKWARNKIYVLGAATFFCIVRIVAFGIRAVLTRSVSISQNKNTTIAESVIYSIGFFGILSGAYNLVLDRDNALGTQNRVPLRFLIKNRHLMRLIILAALVLGIIGAIDSEDPTKTDSKRKTGTLLRTISSIIFLIVCLFMVVNTLFSVMVERREAAAAEKTHTRSFGHRHGMKVLLATAFFLTLREFFYVTTTNNLAKQREEKYFYPLSVGTELIAVITLLVPKLVPPIQGLPR